MKQKPLMLALTAVLGTQAAAVTSAAAQETAPQGNSAALKEFFTNLEGTWRCEGATATGKQTAANVSFTPDDTGKVFTFTQVGTKGHTNTLTSTWAFDEPMQNLVVSRRYISPDGVSSDMFVGERWTANSLTLVAKALWTDLWAQHRFRYEIQPTSFKVTWEVQRDGNWKIGDYLMCRE